MDELDRNLLFSMLTVLDGIKFNDNEFNNTININKKITYLYKVEELIWSYNIKDEVE